MKFTAIISQEETRNDPRGAIVATRKGMIAHYE
jgi:hypothetical protein